MENLADISEPQVLPNEEKINKFKFPHQIFPFYIPKITFSPLKLKKLM